MAAATFAHAKRAVVGRDTRVSGPMLQEALVAGLTAAGVETLLVGVVPTPAVAYLTKAFSADVGFMLTASHNPPQYNFLLLLSGDTVFYTDESQNAVEKLVADHTFALGDWRKVGAASELEASQFYLSMLKGAVKLQKPWRVVVDPGCGATHSIAPAALNAIGCKTTPLNAQPDGYFPARSSEPTAESLSDLAKTVKALGADLGIAFDGDGDRVAFVDEEGGFVDFDRSLAAFGAYALKKSGGGTIVTNVEASMCVETMAERSAAKSSAYAWATFTCRKP
jgi:phosphoglucosamine mutase